MLAWWAVLAAAALGAGGGAARAQTAVAECPREGARPCSARGRAGHTAHFNVNGVGISYEYTEGGFFALKCPPSITLDEPALPRFEPALRVREVRLACPPPARAGSYEAALRALNVIALNAAATGPAPGPSSYRILLELNDLTKFEPSMLTPTSNLRALNISNMITATTDLAQLPETLERLQLTDTTIGVVPAVTFDRLPHLSRLEVFDKKPVHVEAAGNLSWLKINSPGTGVGLSLPDALQWLELVEWVPRRPEPWLSCAGLQSLLLSGAAADTLPDRWLARCGRLRVLELATAANLRSLRADALRGASALREVRLRWGALHVVPPGLLNDARALRVLDLWDNHLMTLPGELFNNLTSLSELSLSKNSLTDSVLGSLKPLTSLSILDLGNNAELDACTNATRGMATGLSPLRHLKSLTELRLDGTATRRVCPDWLQLPRLKSLDLSQTAVTRLTYADLRFNSTLEIIYILLNDLNSMSIVFHREDYRSAIAEAVKPEVRLLLGGRTSLRCDCDLYWAAASMRHTHLRQKFALCEDGRVLDEVPLEDLVCAAAGASCPADCACATREDVERPGPLLRLHCAGAGLNRVPHLDARAALRYQGAEPVALDLRLADNRIARLDPEDLPPDLAALDLRNNSLVLIDAVTATSLVSRATRVLLTGNPLECNCSSGAALTAIRARPDVFRDWNDVTCSNGTRMASLLPCDDDETAVKVGNLTEGVAESKGGGMSRGAIAALTLGVAAAGLAVLGLARLFLGRLPRAASGALAPEILQLECRRPEPELVEWAYDAFVSFAHADEAVVHELVERLEGGAEPLRLCVHYRDWVPGGWIPAQIAASVRVSRRTVAIVSEAFLRSKWARAEFREAYAASLEGTEPRLVLVLLEDPARLRLDTELLAYISGNTYVCWGDPWFWRKLRAALTATATPVHPGAAPRVSGSAPAPEPTPQSSGSGT